MKYLVPTRLETERLILREFRDEDWHALHAYYSDEEATRYTFGNALTKGQTWRTMCGMIGHWQLRRYGPYALERKDDGAVLGTVGFWFPNNWPEPEIKWALAPPYWGNGYASEAARAVLAAGHEHIPKIRLISLIDPDNHGSIHVAQAIGATFEGHFDLDGKLCHVYRHAAAIRDQ